MALAGVGDVVTAAGAVGEIDSLFPLTIMFSIAIMQSVFNIVGIEVGMGNAKRAKEMSYLIIIESLIIFSIISILFSVFRYQIASTLTTNTEIIEMVSSLSTLILPICFFVFNIAKVWNGFFIVLK